MAATAPMSGTMPQSTPCGAAGGIEVTPEQGPVVSSEPVEASAESVAEPGRGRAAGARVTDWWKSKGLQKPYGPANCNVGVLVTLHHTRRKDSANLRGQADAIARSIPREELS